MNWLKQLVIGPERDWLKYAIQQRPEYFDERSREIMEVTGEPTCNGRVITWATRQGTRQFYVLDSGEPSFVRPGNQVILYDQRRVVEIDPATGQILREIADLN